MYLLTYDNENLDYQANQALSGSSAVQTLTMCVPKCEEFSYRYASNPSTMRCEYCGPACNLCSVQYGCVSCGQAANRGQLYPDAYSYSEAVKLDPSTTNRNSLQTLGHYPYSVNPRTKFFGPSSEFQTCIDCVQITKRCISCLVEDPTSETGYSFDYTEDKCQICKNFEDPEVENFCQGPVLPTT